MIGDRMELVVFVRRQCYRLAFRLLNAWWFVTRPHKRGVKCVLTDGDRVLLVRHTYGRRDWELPGGGPRRHEQPLDAARREMREELGLAIDEWTPLGVIEATFYHRHDTLHICHAEVTAPTLKLDRAELATAAWFERDALPDERGRYVSTILARLHP
jgi:8-oxo-dGTP pyrophosphatase MutT (NUDIX family)